MRFTALLILLFMIGAVLSAGCGSSKPERKTGEGPNPQKSEPSGIESGSVENGGGGLGRTIDAVTNKNTESFAEQVAGNMTGKLKQADAQRREQMKELEDMD